MMRIFTLLLGYDVRGGARGRDHGRRQGHLLLERAVVGDVGLGRGRGHLGGGPPASDSAGPGAVAAAPDDEDDDDGEEDQEEHNGDEDADDGKEAEGVVRGQFGRRRR